MERDRFGWWRGCGGFWSRVLGGFEGGELGLFIGQRLAGGGGSRTRSREDQSGRRALRALARLRARGVRDRGGASGSVRRER